MTKSGPELVVRRFSPEDHAQVFAAYAQAVSDGGAFPREPPADEAMFREAWLERATAVFVAHEAGRFAGSYFLRPAFPGLAAHVANAGYVVVADLRRKGIGGRLVQHSLDQARALGFDAMLFNLVQESNPSRRLYERTGFELVGRIPDAVKGEAALIYWRALR